VVHPVLWLMCRVAARHEGEVQTQSVVQRRALAAASLAKRVSPDDGLQVTEHTVTVDGGTVRVRSYREPGDAAVPAHLLAHGGSFWSGSLEQLDALARHYVSTAQCAVFTLDYRLAPEHPWPTPPEDCYAVLSWMAAEAAELRIDPARVSIGGVSAGGCLAAVVAMMARDRGGPPLVFQLLEIPATDQTMSQPSVQKFGSGFFLTKASLTEGRDFYVPNPADRTNPYASPLLAEDLTNLPPAMVLTCEYDPLRDEGETYAARLREAGVPVQLVRAKGHVHASTYLSYPRSGRRYQELTAMALRAAYTA
jgi:acetyl esterase